MAFVRTGWPADAGIYLQPLAGGPARRVVAGPGSVGSPAWSPDGRASDLVWVQRWDI